MEEIAERPRLRPRFALHQAADGSSYLLSEREAFVLRGRGYQRLAPLLDGRRTVAELIRELAGEVSAAEIYYALGRLAERGHLAQPGGEALPGPEAAFWDLQEVEPAAAAVRLGAAAVRVADLAGAGLDEVRRALAAAGLRSDDESATAGLVIAADYLDPALPDLEAGFREMGQPWMLVRPFGSEIWLGPLFVPGITACLECLASRLRAHRGLHSLIGRRIGAPLPLPTPPAALEATVALALHLAATELARWLAGASRPTLEGTLASFDLCRFETRRHAVTRRPQCARCGDPGLTAARGWSPIALQRRPKVWTVDGGHRDREPEATLRQLAHHISPITGAVCELRPFEGPEGEWIRAFSSGPNVAMPVSDEEGLSWREALVSGGKGMTEAQARASALCEALERYCSVFHGDEARRMARLTELGGGAIHPNAVQCLSQGQYQRRDRRAARKTDRRLEIPRPFDEDEPVEWTPVWSLRDGGLRYLPTACCYLGYPESDKTQGLGDFALPDSNGAAAGNNLEEAILQGFLELVERDGVGIWWYNRLQRPGMDLASFEEPWIEAVCASHARMGRSLWLLDLTTDLGIPVLAAGSSLLGDTSTGSVLLGFGAHLEARTAAVRALAEVNQMLRMVPAGARTAAGPEAPAAAECSYLFPDPGAPLRHGEDFPSLGTEDLGRDVETCVDLAARHGLETLVLDQTRPDIGLTVVRVIVPGLRHFRPRFAPGRLYDVPLKMGWLEQPCPEPHLNPHPLLF